MKTPSEFPLTGFSVPRTGIEPARLAAHAPETCASTYSATWAFRGIRCAKVALFPFSAKFSDIFLSGKSAKQELMLENEKVDYCYRDICICEVEDRAEEIIAAVEQKAEPLRGVVPLKKRKIEHVHHLAHHKAGIVPAEMGDGQGCRFGKEQPVEGAVENIAECACENERSADERAIGHVAPSPHAVPDEVADDADHRHAEKSEQQFAPIETAGSGNVHAEGRSFVFDEKQLEPVRKDRDRFAECHVGFDPDFESLIRNQEEYDEECEFSQIHKFHVVSDGRPSICVAKIRIYIGCDREWLRKFSDARQARLYPAQFRRGTEEEEREDALKKNDRPLPGRRRRERHPPPHYDDWI